MKYKRCRDCNRYRRITDFGAEKRNSDGLRSYCKLCMTRKSQAYNQKYRKERLAYSKDYHKKTRLSRLKYAKEYYQRTIEKRRAYGRKYRKRYLKEHPDRVNKTAREYNKKRRKEDPGFRVLTNIRRRLNHLLNGSKSKTTIQLMGCDSVQLRMHLESQFLPGMSWDNYGLHKIGWEVDHIIPLMCDEIDLFNPEDLDRVCHYSNLRPLWEKDNNAKSNKIL